MARQRREAVPRARQHASQRVHGAIVLAVAARRAACAAIAAALAVPLATARCATASCAVAGLPCIPYIYCC